MEQKYLCLKLLKVCIQNLSVLFQIFWLSIDDWQTLLYYWYQCTAKVFLIKIHWKLQIKIHSKWLDYKNALQKILIWNYNENDFAININCQKTFWWKCIEKDFTIECIRNDLIKKMTDFSLTIDIDSIQSLCQNIIIEHETCICIILEYLIQLLLFYSFENFFIPMVAEGL